jgi:hypothetical protein
MELKLSAQEQDLLKEILEEHLRELLMEISRSDHHGYKQMLKGKEQMVESLLEKVGARELEPH